MCLRNFGSTVSSLNKFIKLHCPNLLYSTGHILPWFVSSTSASIWGGMVSTILEVTVPWSKCKKGRTISTSICMCAHKKVKYPTSIFNLMHFFGHSHIYHPLTILSWSSQLPSQVFPSPDSGAPKCSLAIAPTRWRTWSNEGLQSKPYLPPSLRRFPSKYQYPIEPKNEVWEGRSCAAAAPDLKRTPVYPGSFGKNSPKCSNN